MNNITQDIVRNKYSSYLWIDENFTPVFSKDADNSNKSLWKSFIPHSKFEEVLETTLKALERGRTEDKKSIWMYGGYGTGKTHATFVLKHLMEDDIEEIEDYFKIRGFPKNLADRLLRFREQNNILVVFKSGSSHIKSSEKLLLEIQESVYSEYKKYVQKTRKNGDYIPCKTEIQLLRDRLNEDTINWEAIIKKYPRELREISTVEHLKQKLNREEVDISFVERLLLVLEKEGISLFKFSPDKFKEWLSEIYKRDDIKILVIWDEFTQFFKSSESPIDTLQEIVQITSELPFYMFLITHLNEHRINTLSEDVSKLRDRFFNIYYSMEAITTYELISQIIQVKNNKERYWGEFVRDIYNYLSSKYHLDKGVTGIINAEQNLNMIKLRKLFPLHPYSAYLLSQLAQWFGSTNRTIFKFFKSEDKDKEHFIDILKRYPNGDYYLLTPEFLWDYFFDSEESIIDYPELINIMSHWNRYKDILQGNELNVFKLIILLSALSLKITSEIVKPSLDNLKMAFSGTPIYPDLNNILSDFVKRGIFIEYNYSNNKKEYGITSYDIDPGEIEEIKKGIKFENYFKEIKNEIEQGFKDVFLDNRWVIGAVSAQKILKGNFSTSEFKSIKPHQVGVSLIVMDTLDRIGDLKKKVELLSKKPEYNNIIFLISFSELGDRTWDSLKTNMAYEKVLISRKKHREAGYYSEEIKKIIKQWSLDIKNGRYWLACTLNVTTEEFITYEKIDGVQGLKLVFDKILNKIFPYRPDKGIPNTLLKFQNSKEGISIPLEYFRDKGNKNKWRPIYDKFVFEDGIIDGVEGTFTDECKYKRDHPLCKMREVIKEKFEKYDRLSLREVWNDLCNPPFGLYPSPLASYIFGLLMKEYSSGYYYTDGNVSNEVSPAKMVDLIYDVIVRNKNWELLKLSHEQKKFCELIGEIFDISDEDVKYPNKAINSLRIKINRDYKYPLWILKYVDYSNDFEEMEILKDFAKKMMEILDKIVKQIPENTDDLSLGSVDNLIKKFVNELEAMDSFNSELAISRMKDMVRVDNFKNAFQKLANKYITSDVNVSIDSLDTNLRNKLQKESWSWDENKVIEVLSKINYEILLSKKLSEIFGCNTIFLEETCHLIIEKIKNGNYYPLWIYKYHNDCNDEFKRILSDITYLIKSVDKKEKEYEGINLKGLLHDIEKHEELLKLITQDHITAIEQWAKNVLNKSILTEELSAVQKIILNESLKNPLVDENKVSESLKNEINKLKITKLKDKIRYKLKELYKTNNFIEFCRNSYIPISLIKYLPEMAELEISDEFFKNLNNLDRLSEKELALVYQKLEEYKDVLAILNDDNITYKLVSNFLGEKWVENILSDDDWQDLKIYLVNNLGNNIEMWSEQKIKSSFNTWKSEKYNERFYDKIKTQIESMDECEIKQLMSKIVENPNIGFQIIDLLSNR